MEPLVRAIEQSNIDMIRQILAFPNAKEIVNQLDIDMYNSLFHASKIQNEDVSLLVINMLLEKGANPLQKEENKQTILFYLAKEGKAKIIEKLLQSYKYDLNEPDKYNQNPLYWAAKCGRLKVAELLLKYGVNINHLDDNGETCLFFAAAEGHLQMCKFLINRGCQHDLVDKLKKTPLHFAKIHNHVSVKQYLTSLKEQSKKQKIKVKDSEHSDKLQQKKKKKQVQRNEYVLVYTNQDGVVHEMTGEEIEQFKALNQHNQTIYEYMNKPDKLENVQARHQKKFIKVATKIITSYLKNLDLYVFHAPVDTSLYPDYLSHVERPMDFSTIKTKLQFNCYETQEEFKADVMLVFDNCIKYNGSESNLGLASNKLKYEFRQTFKKQMITM